MATINDIQARINEHQARINQLQAQLQVEQNSQLSTQAYQNSYKALFDGLKYTNTQETAVEINIPMMYKANIWFKKTSVTEEGETVTYYVCMPTDGTTEGILTNDNFATVMQEF